MAWLVTRPISWRISSNAAVKALLSSYFRCALASAIIVLVVSGVSPRGPEPIDILQLVFLLQERLQHYSHIDSLPFVYTSQLELVRQGRFEHGCTETFPLRVRELLLQLG
jgi:hypothetical protein